MANLLEKLKAASTVEYTNTLQNSEIFKDAFVAPTLVPMLNVALSGELAGGLTAGVTMWAGPSKHFKTLFSMICAKAYLDKYKDAVLLFYDTEFGAGLKYFKNIGIDPKRVLHTPITNIEIMKHDIVTQLKQIGRGDRVCILVDSFGNMASSKEVEDAEEGKQVTDMTRAKAMKSLFRMIGPHLVIKDIPLVCVNHTYKTLEMFSKDVVSGGTGAVYNSNQVFIIGRQQEKEEKTIIGYNFIINVDKSRFVKEKSKIPISVTFENGISTWSGLLDIALESGHVTNPSKGKYSLKGSKKLYTMVETNSKEFWGNVLLDETFQQWIQKQYSLDNSNLLNTELTDDDVAAEFSAAKAPKAKVEEVVEPTDNARSLRRQARLSDAARKQLKTPGRKKEKRRA